MMMNTTVGNARRISLLVGALVLGLIFNEASAATYYSRNATGAWSTLGSWSLTSHTVTNAPAVLPGVGDIVIIGGGDVMTINSGTTISIAQLIIGNAGTGTLTFGNGTAVTSLTVSGNIIVNSAANAGTLQSGATAAAAANSHNINIAGDLLNNGTVNLTLGAGNIARMIFNGSATRTIAGSGSFIFRNISLQTAAANNVVVDANISISGELNFANDGLLIVNADDNITLAAAATFLNNGATRYIQLDGSSGTNSQLIRITASNITDWKKIYPIGTSIGGYSPLDLTGSTLAGNPTANSTLAVKAIANSSIQGQLRRVFRLVVNGNAGATTFTNAKFNYNNPGDVSSGDNIANYNTIWYLNASTGSAGSWVTTVGGTAPGSGFFTAPTTAQALSTGTYYYTIGTSTAYPNTWYSYQSGAWSTASNWTLDPSGTTLLNPLNTPPASGDEIIITNGLTITVDAAAGSIVASNTTIQGGAILDMSNTTGHNLGSISGSGLLRVNGVVGTTMALPAGTYTNFVTAGTGGTIEYYNATALPYNLPAQATYNNLLLSNTTGSAATYISTNNLTVNGNLSISGGASTATWQINDASAIQRTLTLNGNLTVSANGQIRVGSGTAGAANAHALTIYGNIVNNGSIKFFDANDVLFQEADFPPASRNVFTNALKGNAVNVTFSGVSEQSVICNNTTDFYRLIVNKGTGQQALLTINSTNASYFRLFGPTNQDQLFTYPTDNNAPTRVSANSLSLSNGTLKLEGKIYIPSLIDAGTTYDGWPLPQTAALWLNSPDVTIDVNNLAAGANADWRHIYLYGLLRITNGTINMGYSRGLLAGGSGVFQIEGGTLNTWQLRTTILGSNNNFSYVQSGGEVNIGTTVTSGVAVDDFSRFALTYSTCSFSMSGGALNVGLPTNGGATSNGGIIINSAAANVNVTGGTVKAVLPASNIDFTITSTAPFYKLEIAKTGTTGTSKVALNPSSFDDGTGYTLPVQPLVVLNDLKIMSGGNNPTLTGNGNNITVGGDFEIQTGTSFTPGNNTLLFNGSGTQTWTNSGTITTLYNVTVNKATGSTLTLAGGTFPNITGATTGLTLASGIFNDNSKTVTVTGQITNNAFHIGTGSIIVNGSTLIGGNNGSFGNLTVQTNGEVFTNGDQSVTGNLLLNGATSTLLNIGSNNLTVVGTITSSGTLGTNYRIKTNGLRNDGGLTRQSADAVSLLFPVGTGSIYTPATLNVDVNNVGGVNGKITVRPVSSVHPNVTVASKSVVYYWRVTSSGFASVISVNHLSYTYSAALKSGSVGGAGSNYRPARFDPLTLSWAYGAIYDATIAPGLTIIPNFITPSATTSIDGEYTAGDASAFSTVLAFYSKNPGGNWSVAATWSNDAARVSTASTSPCATCPVIISNNHTINADINSITCGSLQIASGSTLDCQARTGLNFGANTGEVVSGTGTIRINIASGQFPIGDFSKFVDVNGGTVEWYGSSTTSYTIPSTGTAPKTYYNLIVNPQASQTITFPAIDLPVYGTLTKTGAGTVTTDAGIRLITVSGDFVISQGIFTIPVASTTTLNLSGTTTISNGATFSLAGTTAKQQTITTSGSIVNNGTLNLVNTNHVANLIFTGIADKSFTANGTSTIINKLTLNKGTSITPALTLDGTGNVTANTDNWLVLQNGTINFNNTGTPSFTLIKSAIAYTIPETTKLKVQSGTVNVIGNIGNNVADLLLAGALEVAGGDVNINALANNQNFNNDIEYASTGLPTIIVSSGNLYVNGAIRRPLTTLAGSLVYNQSGGNVVLGGRSAANTRGVFEIESNAGSSFAMSGAGVLTISRSTGGALYSDVYINPVNSSVSSTATIQMGMNTNVAVTAALSANIVPSIGSFTLLNGTAAQNVTLKSSDLSTTGTLTLNANTTLTTNALNVNVGGDFIIATGSTYAGSNSTTTFNGSAAQSASLIGSATFLNITVNKASSSTLSLTGSSPTVTNLNLLNGGFDLGSGLTLSVNGDIINYGIQTGDGIITMAGNNLIHSITSLNGAFTNLSLGGTSVTKRINVSGDLIINGTLNFTTTGTSRYLFIQSSKLTFGTTGVTSNEGATRFIRTNGVSSDAGVVKNWPVGTNSFTYAVGTRTNYTPVIFTSLNVTTAGAMRVTPVDNQHPTASATGPLILNYYWIVNHDNTLAYGINTGASHSYQFPNGLLGGFGGTLFGAYLNAVNLDGWNAAGVLNSPTNTSLTFTDALDTNLPLANGTFHYTVGTTTTLPNPVTPVYSRFSEADGSLPTVVNNLLSGATWNSLSSWTLSSDGKGVAVLQIPVGRPVVILPNARINMDWPGLRSFSTKIEGLLVTNTAGHDLGTISGTGTLRTSSSTLPAGTYTAFVSAGGGTIEYIAPMTMNARAVYNNLSIYPSSIGTVIMTNTDLVINGNLSIPTGTALDNSIYNRDVSIAGNWTGTGTGVFNAGLGTVTLNGGANQNMSQSVFNNLSVSNSGGVTLTGSITVNGTLSMNNGNLITTGGSVTVNGSLAMNNGNIITNTTNKLLLGSAATLTGGSTSSFVAGPMRKVMAAGTSFNFPVGSVTPLRYRAAALGATSIAENWEVQYVSKNPLLDGYAPTNLNTTNIAKVSEFEYWNISRVTAASTAAASVTLSYGSGSYLGSDIGNMADLKVVHWNSPTWDVPSGGSTFSQSGTITAGTVTASIVTTFSPFTLGSTQSNSPLPITLVSFAAERSDNNSVLLNWETVQEINNDRFEIERSSDGGVFKKIATVQGAGNSSSIKKYVLTDKEFVSGVLYYRLKQIDFDEKYSYSKVVKVDAGEGVQSKWLAYPNPIESNGIIQLRKANVDDNASINLLLQSSEGKILMKESGTLKEINAKLSKETNSYNPGVYMLQVFDNGSHQIIKVIRH